MVGGVEHTLADPENMFRGQSPSPEGCGVWGGVYTPFHQLWGLGSAVRSPSRVQAEPRRPDDWVTFEAYRQHFLASMNRVFGSDDGFQHPWGHVRIPPGSASENIRR